MSFNFLTDLREGARELLSRVRIWGKVRGDNCFAKRGLGTRTRIEAEREREWERRSGGRRLVVLGLRSWMCCCWL